MYWTGNLKDYNVENDPFSQKFDFNLASWIEEKLKISYKDLQNRQMLHFIMHYINCLFLKEFGKVMFETHERSSIDGPFFAKIHELLDDNRTNNEREHLRLDFLPILEDIIKICVDIGLEALIADFSQSPLYLKTIGEKFFLEDLQGNFPFTSLEKKLCQEFLNLMEKYDF